MIEGKYPREEKKMLIILRGQRVNSGYAVIGTVINAKKASALQASNIFRIKFAAPIATLKTSALWSCSTMNHLFAQVS